MCSLKSARFDHRARFEQQDGDAEVGQHLRDRSAAGARSDDDDVVRRASVAVTCTMMRVLYVWALR